MAALLEKGVAIAVTDYQGLGTPGVHTYLQPVPEAHAVLDAARAAIRLGAVAPTAPIGVWGYSQGGGAAAAAAEHSRRYAGELNLVGTVAGAPAVDPAAVLRGAAGDRGIMSGLGGMFVAGLIDGYPELAPRIRALFNPTGRAYLRRVVQLCSFGALREEHFKPTSAYTKSGATMIDALESDPQIRAVLDSLVVGRIPPARPVLVMQSRHDDTVPPGPTHRMVRSWRAGGATVRLVDVTTPLPKLTGVDHVAGMMDYPIAVDWLMGRFRG
ncbi:MAG: alpha/beta fold hydrolase [Gordonia sp. (in: high G+C Gram-positive bacteria)]